MTSSSKNFRNEVVHVSFFFSYSSCLDKATTLNQVVSLTSSLLTTEVVSLTCSVVC